MTRARGRQAGRPMRFEEVSERRPRRTCMRAAAAAIVGLTARTCRRWHGREALDGAGPGLARLVDGGGVGSAPEVGSACIPWIGTPLAAPLYIHDWPRRITPRTITVPAWKSRRPPPGAIP